VVRPARRHANKFISISKTHTFIHFALKLAMPWGRQEKESGGEEKKEIEDDEKKESRDEELAIVAETAIFALQGPSIQRWQAFMDENEAVFAGRSANDEHTLQCTEVHEAFGRLVDGSIDEFLDAKGWTALRFYELLRDYQAEGSVSVFITLLSSVSDFQAFADIMGSRDKRSYYFQILNRWRQTLEAN
jgi:hypothetical protein